MDFARDEIFRLTATLLQARGAQRLFGLLRTPDRQPGADRVV